MRWHKSAVYRKYERKIWLSFYSLSTWLIFDRSQKQSLDGAIQPNTGERLVEQIYFALGSTNDAGFCRTGQTR